MCGCLQTSVPGQWHFTLLLRLYTAFRSVTCWPSSRHATHLLMIDVDIFMVDNWLINPLLVVDLPRKNSDQKVGMGQQKCELHFGSKLYHRKEHWLLFLVIYKAASTTIDARMSSIARLNTSPRAWNLAKTTKKCGGWTCLEDDFLIFFGIEELASFPL